MRSCQVIGPDNAIHRNALEILSIGALEAHHPFPCLGPEDPIDNQERRAFASAAAEVGLILTPFTAEPKLPNRGWRRVRRRSAPSAPPPYSAGRPEPVEGLALRRLRQRSCRSIRAPRDSPVERAWPPRSYPVARRSIHWGWTVDCSRPYAPTRACTGGIRCRLSGGAHAELQVSLADVQAGAPLMDPFMIVPVS